MIPPINLNSRERLNVYFSMDNLNFKLFHVVNIGKTADEPEFKFSGMGALTIHNREMTLPESGAISEEYIEKSFVSTRSELTYHRDGAMMKKTPDHWNPRDIRINPHGSWQTWTPTDRIETIQLIFAINIRRMSVYRPIEMEKEKERVNNYLLKDCGLFEKEGMYKAIVFLKNKKFQLTPFFSSEFCADILCSVNDKLDLCLYLQRASFPKPISYRSNYFGRPIIKPTIVNSCSFFQREYSNEIVLLLLKSVGIITE